MIETTLEERQWLLRTIALTLVEFMGVAEPPVPVEEMLKRPPGLYARDFDVVDLFSNLWDATFARPLNQRGSIFVRLDLTPEHRRYALARETLCALITSEHGRELGLDGLLSSDLRESAEYFARVLLAPDPMICHFRKVGGAEEDFAAHFGLPRKIAASRLEDAISIAC